jgi:hypothetical protein
MFITRVTTFAERFLTDRSFDLIVAPAIADFEYDAGGGVVAYVAVLRAVAGALYEDATNSSSAGTFLGLALIPAVYYAFFFVLCAPQGLRTVATNPMVGAVLVVLAVIAAMVPVVVCFWPERPSPRQAPRG